MTTELNASEKRRVPWPGPRPYDERDWRDFCGRDTELIDVLNRVRINKLTVLLGGSGTGKTSLIRAGLVPLLRVERYHLDGDETAWPVLLLRRWGNVGSTSLYDNLLFQLKWAINAVQDWGALPDQERAVADAQKLRADLADVLQKIAGRTKECDGEEGAATAAHAGKGEIFEIIEALAQAQAQRSSGNRQNQGNEGGSDPGRGGLILIFDQFEEQLRSGPQIKSDALELIGDLVKGKVPTRILVSMRQEYQYALRPLELIVGPLSGRSYFLEPMKEQQVVDVVEESSKKSNIPIDNDVAARIVRWLRPRSREATTQFAPSAGVALEDTADLEHERGRPDLLQLQAVLLELSGYAKDKYAEVKDADQGRVSMEVFEEFAKTFEEARDVRKQAQDQGRRSKQTERQKERALAESVLGGALERWIESAFKAKTVENASGTSGAIIEGARSLSQATWADMGPEDLRLQVRRIAVRLAPRLSSGDYKLAQEENDLFRQSLGDEIARLGLKDPETRSQVRIIESQEGAPRLNWENLPELQRQGDEEILSGLARVRGWTASKTGDQILVCFKEALHRLATANILQYTPFGADRILYWELVHDQFGPNFVRWAERQRGTWDDCRSSLVVCSGVQPIALTVPEVNPAISELRPSEHDIPAVPGESYDLMKISWQGCGVANSRGERVTFRNVRFLECFLVGTIFDSIDFVDCLFESCELKGGLFRRCSFKGTRFERCDANIAIVGGFIEGLEFRNCHLSQATIDDAKINGEIQYTEGSRLIQGYIGVSRPSESDRPSESEKMRIWFDESSSGALCLWGEKCHTAVKFKNQDLDMRNSVQAYDYKVRPKDLGA